MWKRLLWEYSLAEIIKYHVLSLFGENSDSWLNESIEQALFCMTMLNARCYYQIYSFNEIKFIT